MRNGQAYMPDDGGYIFNISLKSIAMEENHIYYYYSYVKSNRPILLSNPIIGPGPSSADLVLDKINQMNCSSLSSSANLFMTSSIPQSLMYFMVVAAFAQA